MARIVFGVFLLAHSVIHLGWLSPKPDDPKYPFAFKSPWFPDVADATLRAVAPALVAATLAAYVAAALGLFGVPGLAQAWGGLAIAGSLASLAVTILLWHRWFVAGPIIDVAIIAAVVLGWIPV
jgi:hypothetical protein